MKKTVKKLAAILMSSVLCFQGSGVVYAAEDLTTTEESPYMDVSEEDWYFDGVCYMKNNALMTGVGTGGCYVFSAGDGGICTDSRR